MKAPDEQLKSLIDRSTIQLRLCRADGDAEGARMHRQMIAAAKAEAEAQGIILAKRGTQALRQRSAKTFAEPVGQSAATAKGAGKDPGSAAELARAARSGRDDWRELLAEFMTAAKDPSDYSWMRPNRRHIHEGLYLPGVTKESCGEIVIAVDTSGSMSQRDLAAIAAEVQSIAGECKPERLTVIYCDTRIRGVVEIEPEADITLEAQGRGGTAFAPVFEYLARAEEPPQCLIYATDLDGPMVEDPGYPVLWITPEKTE